MGKNIYDAADKITEIEPSDRILNLDYMLHNALMGVIEIFKNIPEQGQNGYLNLSLQVEICKKIAKAKGLINPESEEYKNNLVQYKKDNGISENLDPGEYPYQTAIVSLYAYEVILSEIGKAGVTHGKLLI